MEWQHGYLGTDNMLTREIWDEFFSTDSISRQAAICKLVEDRIHEIVVARVGDGRLDTWYFPDTDEGEMGHFEENLDGNGIQIVVDCRPRLKGVDDDYVTIEELLGE